LIPKTSIRKRLIVGLPLLGILIFFILYVLSTLLYPGGSQADKNTISFSWVHNYWCNLLNEFAMNGEVNPARPFAMTGMFVLCATLPVFCYLFATNFNFSQSAARLITFSGIAAMTISMFLFTGFHNIVISVAGVFGLIALKGTYVGLYKNKSYQLFVMGLFNLFLITVNNILYYSPGLLKYLPVVQKITFLSFLTWICLIDIFMLKKLNGLAQAEAA
jgi:hypothetical protein